MYKQKSCQRFLFFEIELTNMQKGAPLFGVPLNKNQKYQL